MHVALQLFIECGRIQSHKILFVALLQLLSAKVNNTHNVIIKEQNIT